MVAVVLSGILAKYLEMIFSEKQGEPRLFSEAIPDFPLFLAPKIGDREQGVEVDFQLTWREDQLGSPVTIALMTKALIYPACPDRSEAVLEWRWVR